MKIYRDDPSRKYVTVKWGYICKIIFMILLEEELSPLSQVIHESKVLSVNCIKGIGRKHPIASDERERDYSIVRLDLQ